MHAQCVICGDTISRYLWGENIFLEDDNWKEAYRTTGKLWTNADKVETRYFMQDENQWGTLYRLIVYDPATNRHRLTGIGQALMSINNRYIKEDYYRVPSNKHKAVIGFPGEQTHDPDLIAVQYEYLHWWFFTAEPKTDWRKLAVSIHMRCWNLAICVLGPVVETHLDIFTALALRKVREWEPDYDECTEDPTGSTEPFKILAFRNLIQKCQNKGEKKVPQGNSRPTLPFSRLLYLPHEIRCLILDYLDYTDIAILKSAVQYHIGESYWRARMAFYLIGINDELSQIENEKIDWEYLCLETEKLDATTDIFKTRRRAIRILTGIKEKLFKILHEGHIPSLKDVINDVQNEMIREYWDWYKQRILDTNNLGWTSKGMLRSLTDAGFLERSFWKLENSQVLS
ncbi:hypothetical protein SI65_09839 [Aspergillus cristatus]|uniref:F-box domain-containing protein n=1 Tax=Aspergillus cristatus TaxID=573508 RepID=A0A1E3B1P2_ASPCR|nr:hypothetical protein SI65_09839 [Aspergillus cristatus]